MTFLKKYYKLKSRRKRFRVGTSSFFILLDKTNRKEAEIMIDDYLESMNTKLDDIQQRLDVIEGNVEPVVLGTGDIMELLGCNRATAINLFKQKDFPRIKGIKANKVEKQALLRYIRNN